MQTSFQKEHRSQDLCHAPSAGQVQYFLWCRHWSHPWSPLVPTSASTYLGFQFHAMATYNLETYCSPFPREWLQQPLWHQHCPLQIALLKYKSISKTKANEGIRHLHGKSATLPTSPQHYSPPLPHPYLRLLSSYCQPSGVASIAQQTPGIFIPELGPPSPHEAALAQLPQPWQWGPQCRCP